MEIKDTKGFKNIKYFFEILIWAFFGKIVLSKNLDTVECQILFDFISINSKKKCFIRNLFLQVGTNL